MNNRNSTLARWIAIILVAGGMLVGIAMYITNARASTISNRQRIEKLEHSNGKLMRLVTRIDKRQALIAQKLDVRFSEDNHE